MPRPSLIVFASGTKDGGGSGFENLVQSTKGTDAVLGANIVAVVSNHPAGGVRNRAERLGVPFIHMPQPYTKVAYQEILKKTEATWVALSGWLKRTEGLNPQRTFNIHPGPLHDLGGAFGGTGMYGHHVHEAVRAAYNAGKIASSAASMHFVTEGYDEGPVFFEHRVPLHPDMTADEIATAVNAIEHMWQPRITHMVVHEEIAWDGEHVNSLRVPQGYKFLPSHS